MDAPREIRLLLRRRMGAATGVLATLCLCACSGDSPTDGGPDPVVLEPAGLCADHSASDIATFADANLEAAVRTALSVGTATSLTCQRLAALSELFSDGSPISSLVGIQNLPNLTFLSLGESSLTTIGPLASLTRLQILDLSFNSISDLTPLAGLANLEGLFLPENSVSDLTPLGGLSRLQGLALYDNLVTDVTPLSGLTSLVHLYLGRNAISSIDGLADLSLVQSLGLQENSVTDITALSDLPSLLELELQFNPDLSNVQPLLDNTRFIADGQRVDLRGTSVSCDDYVKLFITMISVEADPCQIFFGEWPVTLQPGEWTEWRLDRSKAQPMGATTGDFDRTRLNHEYGLSLPAGFVRWGAADPDVPVAPFSNNIFAFQTEFDGTQWNDVLRIAAASDGPPLVVSVVVVVPSP